MIEYATLHEHAEVHTPHPGSARDMVAKTEPAVPAVQDEQGTAQVIVPVRDDMPEECIPRTVQLNTNNTFLPVLPRDMRRRRAVMIPVNQAIWLCENREMASQAAGVNASSGFNMAAYVPSGTNLVINSRDQMWVASTTTATTSIAVIVERYAEDV